MSPRASKTNHSFLALVAAGAPVMLPLIIPFSAIRKKKKIKGKEADYKNM
jgi:hypothetical protein